MKNVGAKRMLNRLNTKLLRITLAICCALFFITSAAAEGSSGHSSKKAKRSVAAKKKNSESTKSPTPAPEMAEDISPPDRGESDKHGHGNSNPQSPPASNWEFSVTPYLFLARLNGTVGALGRTAQVNASFSDIFHNLDFAAMGTFEARKGNWLVLVDGMYISLSGKKVTPNPLFSDIDVEVKELVFDPEVGYRVVKGKGGTIDLLAGARIWHVKSHITFQPRISPLVDVEESKNWADPVVGARGIANLSPRTFLIGKFDVGGFGISSDFTGQAFGGVGFQVKPRVALLGGYRYLRVDYVNGGFIFKTDMSGIALGAKFKL